MTSGSPCLRISAGTLTQKLADTEIEALPEMVHRWAALSNDGFEEFVLSRPFEGLEFGARSYDEQTDAE